MHRFALACGCPSLLLNDDTFAALATDHRLPVITQSQSRQADRSDDSAERVGED
jgi:hypothetical protein